MWWNIVKIALAIVGALILFEILAIVFKKICQRIPGFRWILALILGVVSYVIWETIIVSVLVFIFSAGFFILITSASTKRGNHIRCHRCGCDMVDIYNETDEYLQYKCPRCGNNQHVNLYR